MTAHLLAALAWDPQIRGALIVLTAILILPVPGLGANAPGGAARAALDRAAGAHYSTE